jgi:hypothetical protein
LNAAEAAHGSSRAGKPRWRLVISAAAAVVALVVAWIAIHGVTIARPPTSSGALAHRLALSVDQPIGQCPHAVYKFTAIVSGVRAGEVLTYRWDGPADRVATDSMSSPAGQDHVAIRYQYEISGRGSTSGDVTFRLLTPSDSGTAPVHIEYDCP